MEVKSARFRPRIPHFDNDINNLSHAPRHKKRVPNSTRKVQPPSTNHQNNFNSKNISIRSNRIKSSRISPVVNNGPISPKEALDFYSHFLNDYEKQEILNFPEIYFVGRYNKKITPEPNNQNNYDYDDETNNYKLVAGDHLAYRFEIQELFGAGAFGQVVKCYDHKRKQFVAIKVIVNTEQMHEQGQIEAAVLARLNSNHCPNIVEAYDYFVFRSHICMTFEILGMNLFEYSQSIQFHPLSTRVVRIIGKQIFSALAGIHSLNVIHCDLKPENILLVPGSHSLIKLLDFGSSCFGGHQKYEYIQSRFYRAPEVLIGIDYGPPMDVWGAALILIELLIGMPLFPGVDEIDQLWYIVEVLGLPPQSLVRSGRRREEFFDSNLNLKNNPNMNRIPASKSLKKVLHTKDPYIIDFLEKCLTWNPLERITASQALRHPFLTMKEFTVGSKASKILPEITYSTRMLEPPV